MAEQARDPNPVPLVVVDGANVVGSVPDGWWRDRRAATERLRDALAPLARDGLAPADGVPAWAVGRPLDLLLVVEGAARGVAEVPGVRVAAAPGSGDDLVVQVVAAELGSERGSELGPERGSEHGSERGSELGPEPGAGPARRCLVVTADRELRARVTTLGADVAGPRAVRPM